MTDDHTDPDEFEWPLHRFNELMARALDDPTPPDPDHFSDPLRRLMAAQAQARRMGRYAVGPPMVGHVEASTTDPAVAQGEMEGYDPAPRSAWEFPRAMLDQAGLDESAFPDLSFC